MMPYAVASKRDSTSSGTIGQMAAGATPTATSGQASDGRLGARGH
jgi:hypothetical protein